MIDKLVVELWRECLVVDQDHISSLENVNDALLFQEITPNKMGLARCDTPEPAAGLEFRLLELCQIACVVHHLAAPAFTADFKSSLQNHISNARPEVDKYLAGFELRFLEDVADKSGKKFAVDVVRSILILPERFDSRGYRARIRLGKDAFYPG